MNNYPDSQGATLVQPRPVVQVAPVVPVARPARRPWLLPALAGLTFVASFLANSYRLAESVDLKSDEATYAIESASFNRTGMTRWNGGAFLVHPPLFFIIEGAYFNALGVGYGPLFDRLISKPYTAGEPLLAPTTPLTGTSMLDAIVAARYLSAIYGAITAVIIFLLGSALLDWRMGALSAFLFMIDPYTLWRNHFNYLEPLAALFGVLMVFVYYRAQSRVDQRQRNQYLLVAGLFFGLALLTKELALIYLPPLLVHSILFRRTEIKEIAIPVVTGLAMYSLFPLWAASQGQLGNWWNSRTWLFGRISGEIRDTGVDRPGSSLARTLSVNLPDYWPWFLLMAVAALVAAAFVYFHVRYDLRDGPAEFLSSLVIGSYGFFVIVKLVGGVINEHFFYLLMPFVALTVAYGTLEWPRLHMEIATLKSRRASRKLANQVGVPAGARLQFKGDPASHDGATPLPVEQSTLFQTGPLDTPRRMQRLTLVKRGLIVALAGLTAYNVLALVARYGFSSDNSYARLEGALATSLPPGQGVVGRDLLDLYLMPKNGVYTFSYLNYVGRTSVDPANLIERKIPYAILNDQSLLEGYGGANPVYYDWVRENGKQIDQFRGRLYNTYAYKLEYTARAETFGADSLSFGKPATASSNESANSSGPQFTVTYTPNQAFDGKITTRWASGETDNQWIYVDLGRSINFGRVELRWEQAYARRYDLQTSEDAKTWTTFYSTTTGAGGNETITRQAKGRYVRLLMTRRGSEFGFSLWEIAIYP
ncbi:MAG TPA: discoidin domain-containing protein [Chloroflexia bacterium]|nr:discoidin domain-containing protein [Chloroflexia bacterium]